ncbi:hypothetical protein IMZ11_21205 [Microtetraspora sp. AC03309]|uniref:hypothetical protein n=1 Tax=Microtetraspora sp. AC03309 TaxID=2779376 RepID=UPI001E4F9655|nr:hypothetical protein [Microtetraspora sp. AC03309]MCC5578149.1 hypothetical protein [Microtetraspora sp. AC03309]
MKNSTIIRTARRTARAAGAAALLTVVAVGGLTAPAEAAAARLHWGPVQSKGGHGGYAKADVWITDFSAETFVVSGTLYDRDRHDGHCAYIRARFHYAGGGTGWAQPRSTCAAKSSFRLSSDGEITRVDVKVCVLDKARRATVNCYVDPIKASTVANWPQ